MEAEALKKLEEEKKAEEARFAEELKKDPKAKPKAPPPAKKGGKGDDKPQVDVPKLEVPEIQIFDSKMGKKYLVERNLEEIAVKLLTPAPQEDDAVDQDAEKAGSSQVDQDGASPDGAATPSATPGDKGGKPSSPEVVEGEEGEEKEQEPELHPYLVKDDIVNDHLDKAALSPP